MGTDSGTAQPTDAVSLNSEGCRLLERGQYEEAIALFSEALRLSPAFYDAYRNRAEAYRSLGRTALAKSDLAAALRLVSKHETRPWHQTWWATAIWLWIPLVVWYGLYVFFAKLRWKERGAVVGTVIGVFATICVAGVIVGVVGVFRGSDDSRLASNDYEKQVVVLVSRSRDASDRLGTQMAPLRSDPDLIGESYLARAKPIGEQYRNDMVDLKSQWSLLQPPNEALEFHAKGAEYWDFEIASAENFSRAETEEEYASAYVDGADEEQKLSDEFNRLYTELLSH